MTAFISVLSPVFDPERVAVISPAQRAGTTQTVSTLALNFRELASRKLGRLVLPVDVFPVSASEVAPC
jgi:hypothetical protein